MKPILSFEPDHIYLLFTGFAFLAASICSFEIFQKHRTALLFLFIAGLLLCSFVALLDPFLNSWDERFHALVAKNMLRHPLKPTLYETPLLPYNPGIWISNHVWLHKQPLFLWQIALSLKLFGLSEFSVRIPSVLMMSLAPLLIYRTGKHALNVRTGYYAALLFATSFFVHELVTGFPASDHNDIAFIFYITASIWAWTEYQHSHKKYWLVLIGIFSGAAILVKWLTGLLVFSGWGLSVLADKEKRRLLTSYIAIAVSAACCAAVFVPWQIYISQAFPAESAYEYSLNAKHFSEVVEGHGGDVFYYFDNLNKVYGEGLLVPFVIIIALVLLYFSIEKKTYRIAFFTYIIFVYGFFTLAATKMTGFCFVVSPLIFLALANLIEKLVVLIRTRLIKKIQVQHFIVIALLLVVSWANLNLHKIAYKHGMYIRPNDNDKRITKVYDACFIRSLKNYIPSDDYVLFNCKPQTNISVMFYTNLIAYDTNLSYAVYTELKRRNIKMAVIDNGKPEPFILNDPAVIRVKAPDQSWY